MIRAGNCRIPRLKSCDISNEPVTNPDCRYLLCIPSFEIGKKVVISFSIRANPFSRVCLFCNFVRNRIYVMTIEVLELVFMARYHNI
jgi:hypothetical protein